MAQEYIRFRFGVPSKNEGGVTRRSRFVQVPVQGFPRNVRRFEEMAKDAIRRVVETYVTEQARKDPDNRFLREILEAYREGRLLGLEVSYRIRSEDFEVFSEEITVNVSPPERSPQPDCDASPDVVA